MNKINFVCNFQQKSADNLHLNKIITGHNEIFPIKNISIVPTIKYVNTLSNKLFNYREDALNSNSYLNVL